MDMDMVYGIWIWIWDMDTSDDDELKCDYTCSEIPPTRARLPAVGIGTVFYVMTIWDECMIS